MAPTQSPRVCRVRDSTARRRRSRPDKSAKPNADRQPDHLHQAQRPHQRDIDAELLGDLAHDRVLHPLAEIDLAAGQVPAARLRRALQFHQQQPPVANDRRAAADAGPLHCSLRHSLAQRGENPRPGARAFVERAALVFFVRRMDRVVVEAETHHQAVHAEFALEGADDRDRAARSDQHGGVPHSASSARRARRNASLRVGSPRAGLPP